MDTMYRALFTPALVLAVSLGLLACAEQPIMRSAPMTTVSAATASMFSPPANPTDSRSGPAFRTVSGKLKHIVGRYYGVEEYTGNVVRLHVGCDTVKLTGNKKPGDTIRAEITRGGHANTIQ